jgi:uncharacterized membrane protein YhaH (DUF805 family)
MPGWLEKELSMLGFVFGFNARLGRLHYFLATIGLAVLMTFICFVIAGLVYRHHSGASLSRADLMGWPTVTAMVFFAWMSFTLQSMRIRDIGWDPVCVIPVWIAILVVDMLVAAKIPAWSLGPEHHGTVVGALFNVALFLALLFWPSGDYEDPTFDAAPRRPEAPSRGDGAAAVAAARIARGAGSGFGRRAF